MKQITACFLKKYENVSFIERQKAKMLLHFNLIAIPIVTIYIILAAINHSYKSDFLTNILLPVFFIVIVMIDILLIKKGFVKFAGNFLTTCLIILEFMSLFQRLYSGGDYHTFYAGGYYYLLVFLVVGALFSTISNFLLDTSMIFVGTITIFFLSQSMYDADTMATLKMALINYLLAAIALFTIIWFFKQASSKSMKLVESEAKEKDMQNTRMTLVIQKIQTSSQELFQASNQLSSISQQITQRANEQALTTAKISTSMQQVMGTILNNTENAGDTHKKSTRASENLQKSSKVILQTIDLVNQILSKTEVIADIAFQTNLLSFNASIEAAHAEQYGKGFAAVAHEIRGLAEKSKLASAEIKKLSKSGKDMSQMARKVLEKSLTEIAENATSMKNIATDSQNQIAGTKMISVSIQQLAGIASENSALAEEMSTSAEQLSAQAEQLQQITHLTQNEEPPPA